MDIKNTDHIKEIDSTGYFVDNQGNVYTTHYRKGHETKRLKPHKLPNGYYIVHIGKQAKYVHRLVAQAFILNPDNKPEVNHKDLDKSNNAAYNLEWSTRHENENHLKDNSSCHGKTASNSGVLYHGETQVAHFRSLQKAKEYCRLHYNATLCTIKDLNVCYKKDLYYIRDNSTQTIHDVIKQHQLIKENNDKLQKHRNKTMRGIPGTLFYQGNLIGEFLSVRDAIQYSHCDLKRKQTGLYSGCGYEYRVKCND